MHKYIYKSAHFISQISEGSKLCILSPNMYIRCLFFFKKLPFIKLIATFEVILFCLACQIVTIYVDISIMIAFLDFLLTFGVSSRLNLMNWGLHSPVKFSSVLLNQCSKPEYLSHWYTK